MRSQIASTIAKPQKVVAVRRFDRDRFNAVDNLEPVYRRFQVRLRVAAVEKIIRSFRVELIGEVQCQLRMDMVR
jgi:hypothetical protein